MKALASLGGHLGLLAMAAALAGYVYTSEDKPTSDREKEVEVWGGKADGVRQIRFENAERNVELVAHEDKQGRWYVGVVKKQVSAPPPRPTGDAGAPPPKPKLESKTERFVSVGGANDLAESLAPLMAFRSLGSLDKARAEEFGFDEPEGTVRVKIGDNEHTLVLGGTTPGGGDRYARVGESGQVYAVPGEIARNLMFAESRLIERDLHDFEEVEPSHVKVTGGDSTRELVRVEGKKDGWARASSPTKLDETAGNWMSKLGRLRVMQYREKPPVGKPVVRVEYFDGDTPVGYLELVKVEKGEKPAYFAKTEHTRWYAEVLQSLAEQVEQDVAALLK